MKDYIGERIRHEHSSRAIGIVITLALHAGGVYVCATNGLDYLDPPPPETTFLMDFTQVEELPEPKPKPRGTAPRSEEVDRTKPIELVQKSESQYAENIKDNLTPQTADDPFGDVPVPETKPEEPRLDPRASFPGMAKKDTSLTAPHSAEKASDTFKAGQAGGNSDATETSGKPNALLSGRTTLGVLPKPSYNVQTSGKVVVTIWVDPYGNVQKAMPGADGTTVTDKNLWAAARSAAMHTHFNMNSEAPALQKGQITYIFNLK